jgi:hypothetical protein
MRRSGVLAVLVALTLAGCGGAESSGSSATGGGHGAALDACLNRQQAKGATHETAIANCNQTQAVTGGY